MSTLSFSVTIPAAGTSKARSTLASLIQTIGAEWRSRRATRTVESLSDEMLHDIGIARGEIGQAVRHGRAWR